MALVLGPNVHEFRVCLEVDDAATARHPAGIDLLQRRAARGQEAHIRRQVGPGTKLEVQDDQLVVVAGLEAEVADVGQRQVEATG